MSGNMFPEAQTVKLNWKRYILKIVFMWIYLKLEYLLI